MISNHLCLVRGGGDLGTGVTMQLKRKGIPVVVSDLKNPLAVRRKVSLSTAIIEKNVQINLLLLMKSPLADDTQGVVVRSEHSRLIP